MEAQLENNHEESELHKIASRKVVKLKSFYSHLFVYAVGIIIYFLKEYTELPLNIFPIRYMNCFVMILWTAVMVGSAIDIFASFRIFGDEWEARKVKSILEKREKKQKWE